MKIKNYFSGFTLVELMVVVMITMLLVGGGLVSLSKYHHTEEVNESAAQLAALLTMARSLAMTQQIPEGFNNNLNYVVVTINNNGLVQAMPYDLVNGVGTTYFARDVIDAGIGLTTPGNIRFAAGSGKLVAVDGTPLATGSTLVVSLHSGDGNSHKEVSISEMGVIK